MLLVRAASLAVEPLGESWVFFSPLSGETHLINDTSVAMLECLDASRPTAADSVYLEIAGLTGSTPAEVARMCSGYWSSLVEAGAVRVMLPQPLVPSEPA